MKLFWNYIVDHENIQYYALLPIMKRKDDYIKFRDTLGFIERQPNGKFLCFVDMSCIGEEPNKIYAQRRVEERVTANENTINR